MTRPPRPALRYLPVVELGGDRDWPAAAPFRTQEEAEARLREMVRSVGGKAIRARLAVSGDIAYPIAGLLEED